MKAETSVLIHLLHGSAAAALATQSAQLPGYPHASILPFVPDERHCPILLVSRLAEHTRNLRADPRASLLVTPPGSHNVLEEPRLTLIGDATPLDIAPAMLARYLRYQPDARQYLELGDFAFFRLQPKRARYIGGFARMGWIDETQWGEAAALDPADEQACCDELAAALPADIRLLGLDCYGADLEQGGRRQRQPFPNAPIAAPDLRATAAQVLKLLT
ncbi:pyridoxamine 5'-phosphate oxidase family protein [Candidimonas humi]|uniref:HugZ family protein n=1 Tax=Candidimonas humi TaxID=683355 RepID=A0ABV8NY54_9BURK|nr:pyridoxamine 5'-phosphate oxidase family protein [Candidimonas humi]MBV6304244.1 pyridoxamine 5'-phosphate oxidase family protein [Candidimonas humi]